MRKIKDIFFNRTEIDYTNHKQVTLEYEKINKEIRNSTLFLLVGFFLMFSIFFILQCVL